MLEKFLDADSRGFDDITGWMDDDIEFSTGVDDFMREVSSMMDDPAGFE